MVLETGAITAGLLFLMIAANVYGRMLAMSTIPMQTSGLIAGLIRGDDLNLSGAFDPYNAELGFAHPGNIDTVLVGGDVKKRGGKMLRDDIAALQEALAVSGRRIFEEFKAKAATAEFA